MENKEELQCFTCGAEEVNFLGISSCNHYNCGKCAIKLQILAQSQVQDSKTCDYGKCVTCRQPTETIIITKTLSPFEDFNLNNLLYDKKRQLYFDTKECQDFCESILRIDCFICKEIFQSKKELIKHMPKHNLDICDLCGEYNMDLPSEMVAMNKKNLISHTKKFHPVCKFCKTNHYNKEHLIKHVKTSHFLCDICLPEVGFVAYNTQEELLNHFTKDHFICRSCKSENVINVFNSNFDLNLHRETHHKYIMKENVLKQKYNTSNLQQYKEEEKTEDVAQEVPSNYDEDFPDTLGGTKSITKKKPLTRNENNDLEDVRYAFATNVSVSATNYKNIEKNKKEENRVFANVTKRSCIIKEEEFPCLSHNISGFVKTNANLQNKNYKNSLFVQTKKIALQPKNNSISLKNDLTHLITKKDVKKSISKLETDTPSPTLAGIAAALFGNKKVDNIKTLPKTIIDNTAVPEIKYKEIKRESFGDSERVSHKCFDKNPPITSLKDLASTFYNKKSTNSTEKTNKKNIEEDISISQRTEENNFTCLSQNISGFVKTNANLQNRNYKNILLSETKKIVLSPKNNSFSLENDFPHLITKKDVKKSFSNLEKDTPSPTLAGIAAALFGNKKVDYIKTLPKTIIDNNHTAENKRESFRDSERVSHKCFDKNPPITSFKDIVSTFYNKKSTNSTEETNKMSIEEVVSISQRTEENNLRKSKNTKRKFSRRINFK